VGRSNGRYITLAFKGRGSESGETMVDSSDPGFPVTSLLLETRETACPERTIASDAEVS